MQVAGPDKRNDADTSTWISITKTNAFQNSNLVKSLQVGRSDVSAGIKSSLSQISTLSPLNQHHVLNGPSISSHQCAQQVVEIIVLGYSKHAL